MIKYNKGVNMLQPKLLKDALKNNYIVPAFNFANFEILKGILKACKQEKSPVILQISESAMNYFTDELLLGIILGIRKLKQPISIHLDHGKSFEVCKRAIKLGMDSVMIDGSTLPYLDNIKLTKKVVQYAHKRNVSVEGELGMLKRPTDDANLGKDEHFTNPKRAKEFVELTGVDSLAVSIGTNHGVNKYVGVPKIHFDILKKIEKELPDFPLVLHGASLVEKQVVDSINSNGGNITKALGNENLLKNVWKTNICKINMDTDFRLTYTAGVRKHLNENPLDYCPRTYGTTACEMVVECAKKRIEKICKSNNRC